MERLHKRVRIDVTFDLNVWWTDQLVHLLKALPGIRAAEVVKEYQPKLIEAFDR